MVWSYLLREKFIPHFDSTLKKTIDTLTDALIFSLWRVSCFTNISLTRYNVNIISPWSPLAISTSIRPSILSVGHVSSRTSSTPSLMLYSKGSVTKSQSNQSTFQNSVCSSPVIVFDKNIFTIIPWNRSSAGISVAANWCNCEISK